MTTSAPKRMLLISALLFALPAFQVEGSAASPRNVVKNIVFRKGSKCWEYNGPGSEFIGRFGAGQRVVVRMSPREGGSITPVVFAKFARDDYGSKGLASDNLQNPTGTLSFIAPRSDRYSIWILPAIIWNSPGYVEICAY